MLEQHKELMQLIEAAEKRALAMYNGGARPLEGVVRGLRQVGREVATRIRAYESMAKKAAVVAPAESQPADAGENSGADADQANGKKRGKK